MRSTLRQIAWLLSPQQRRAALLQGLLVLIGMVLETASIALIALVMAVVTGSAEQPQISELSNNLPLLLAIPKSLLLAIALAVLVAFYLIKCAVVMLIIWRQSAFVAAVSSSVSCRLARHYLLRPYLYHTTKHSADLITMSITEANVFGLGVNALVTVATETLTCAGIGVLLFAIEPLAATSAVLVFACATLAFQWLLNSRIRIWATARHAAECARLKVLQESLHAIKSIKATGCEEFFLSRYSQATREAAIVNQRQSTASQAPRVWYELIAVLAIAALSGTMLLTGVPTHRAVPILALFAAAAFRLLPSASRLMAGIQAIRNAAPATAAIVSALSEPTPKALPQHIGLNHPSPPKIEVRNATFLYPNKARPALADFSATIAPGESVGIIGASGAGKSTLVDLLLGLIEPDRGEVLGNGSPIHENQRAWQRRIGYVPQSICLMDADIATNIAFGVHQSEIDEDRIKRIITLVQLDDFVASQPSGLHTPVGEHGIRMSGGQRQRLGIARALYSDPDVLLLDEATSALDTKTEAEIMTAIDAMRGTKTIIIVSHRDSTISKCDTIYRLHMGVLDSHGPPEAVLNEIA